MKNRVIYPHVLTLTFLLRVAPAATITVNTADNTDFTAGKTNLVTAINLAASGDMIAFNIPGTGPHHLITPVGGYPVITNHNLLIDGYTQPGSSPNTNTMLAANNAVLKIVLDSQNGEGTSNAGPGFGAGETGVLFLMGTNWHVRGLCFLGAGNSSGLNDKAAINIGNTAHDAHVSGCWIGVDVDGTTLHLFDRGPTAFGDVVNNVPSWPIGTVIGVKAGPADTAGARAQQNVIVGGWVNIFMESMNMVIAGNKLNVLPDGMHDVDQNVAPLEAVIESGRVNNNMRVGTDGDGLNDAEERNVFGGISSAGDNNIIEIYGQNGVVGRCTNIVIAGNYFGVAVDGVTRFTNAMLIVDHFTRTVSGVRSDCQFGSDFDGVSDDVEANLIYMNNPFSALYPDPSTALLPGFCNLTAEGTLSLRGNKLVNNNLLPFGYANFSGGLLTSFTNYESPQMDLATGPIIPTLEITNIYPHLKGTFALGTNGYTNIIIDVYQLDPEGWTNGKTIVGAQNWPEMTDGATYTNGFAQGWKYLGSRVVANTGSFDINISGMDLGPGAVTVTVNYSADPPGTHRGRVHTSNFSFPVYPLPGAVASVGLTNIVPDMLLWYNTDGYVTNGPANLAKQDFNLQNWEPYASALGDSTFLVEFTTYATGGSSLTAGPQNNVVALQPAAGGTAQLAFAFYSDAGAPFKDQINQSRQNGNPGRVAGDPRYGAGNYVTEAEASLGFLSAFQSNSRWTNNPIYGDSTARYACAQPFALNPLTLVPTPLAQGWDYIYGPFVTANPPVSVSEVSRTGGRPIGLDNGNFVVMNHDKTQYLFSGGDATTFSIITPGGSIVKSATLAKGQDIWDNLCAYRGGFAIRCHNSLLFYDNAGSLVHSNDVNTSSGLSFGTGREDASRIAGDIRGYYVFLGGKSPDNGKGPVTVGVWDSRTGNFVTSAQASDGDPALLTNDRVSLAVDALNRICVAWDYQPTTDFPQRQIAARVMQFDGTQVTPLTHSFYPFVNHDVLGNADPFSTTNMLTWRPSVAMTTRQICITGKGHVSSTNNPTTGADTVVSANSPPESVNLYTVISHPAPVAAPQPQMTIIKSGNNAVISWLADAGLFVLQSTPAVSPTSWSDAAPQPAIVRVGAGDANDRYQMTVPVGTDKLFFRLLRRW